MEYQDCKTKFIETWGQLATSWGVTRTMAQIHALLLVSIRPLCEDEIIDALKISRGNANMNLRELIEWKLVFRHNESGGRKAYYTAEKDIHEVFRCIALYRKKRELEPVIQALDEMSQVDVNCSESAEFAKMVSELKVMSCQADALLAKITKKEASWMLNGLSKLLR